MSKGKRIPLWQKAVIKQQMFMGTPHENEWHVQDDETGAMIVKTMSMPAIMKRLLDAAGIDPALSPSEAMDKYFYDELCKPRKLSGTNQDILDRAKKEHPDWPCPGSIQDMRYRADLYQEKHGLPKRPARKRKSS